MIPRRARFLARLCVRSTSTTSPKSMQEILENRLTNVVPEKFNFARDVIDFWAAKEQRNEKSRSDSALKIIGLDGQIQRKINYTELSQLSKQLAGGLINELGLTRKDRILICVPRCAEFWILTAAALRAGIEFTTVTPQALARDLRYRIQQFEPTVVFSEKTNEVDEACYPGWPVKHKLCVNAKTGDWRPLQTLFGGGSFEAADTLSSENALVYFTSGTTGYPKMVQHTYAYTLGHMSGLTNIMLEVQTGDDFLCTADTGWAKTAFGTYPLWLAGGSIVVDLSTRFDPNRLIDVMEKHKIPHMSSAPTVYRMMIAQRSSFNFPNLRGVYSGGEPLSNATFNRWKEMTGIEIREGYAQSETLLLCAGNSTFPAKPGSIGKPVKEFQIEILDDNLQPVGPNESGQLAVKIKPHHPLGLFVGYKDNPEATEKAFRGEYYMTGDRVQCDEEGYVWFVSRCDDIINSAGYRIGPFEIETILNEHSAVVESACVGVPDPERIELVKAFVVLKDPAKASDALKKELQNFVKERTAPYKYPRLVEFVSALPKTTSGKVQRHMLKK